MSFLVKSFTVAFRIEINGNCRETYWMACNCNSKISKQDTLTVPENYVADTFVCRILSLLIDDSVSLVILQIFENTDQGPFIFCVVCGGGYVCLPVCLSA